MAVKVRYRKLDHEGGTKWYGVIEIFDSRPNLEQALACAIWGPHGKVTGGELLGDGFNRDQMERAAHKKLIDKGKRGYKLSFDRLVPYSALNEIGFIQKALLQAIAKRSAIRDFINEALKAASGSIVLIDEASSNFSLTTPAHSQALTEMEDFGDW